jgi:hypothetical protein
MEVTKWQKPRPRGASFKNSVNVGVDKRTGPPYIPPEGTDMFPYVAFLLSSQLLIAVAIVQSYTHAPLLL